MRQTRINRFADVHEALEVTTVVARVPNLAIAEGSAEQTAAVSANCRAKAGAKVTPIKSTDPGSLFA